MVLATVLVVTGVFGGDRAAEGQNAVRRPVLLELFTSEGCSSCPPVDAWVQNLDSSQPVPGVQIIVLSEHVDYWDQDGWKDPYSSTMVTDRQREYAQGLGLKDVYTPQLILDGNSVLRLNDAQQVEETLEKAAAAPGVLIRIDSAGVEAGHPGVLHGRIEVDAQSEEKGDVYVATALDHAESTVLRGENGGRKLSHVAVVENIVKIGKLEKGKSFEHDFQIELKPGSDPANLRVVAFVQEPNLGPVLGAAMTKNLH
ncbi:MAG: DUF1223 domain-containing protein [Candidatus Sulfotelmatobacter sp.]